MTTTTNTVTEIRNSYKALMAACLAAKPGATAAEFNRKCQGLMHELADGEPYETTPAFYLRAAQEVAYYEYNVNFRTVSA